MPITLPNPSHAGQAPIGELNDDTHNTECLNCATDLDWKFIASIKKNVEENMDLSLIHI